VALAFLRSKARWVGALAGIASAAVAIGLAELIAALVGPNSAPIVAVGEVVIDATPLPVKEFAADTFGTSDKTALKIGIYILLTIFAAIVGMLAQRDIRFGYAGIGFFGLIGVVAAVTRHGAAVSAALPSLIGAVAGAVLLYELLVGPRTRRPDLQTSGGRRSVLIGSGLAIVGAGVAGVIGRNISDSKNVSEQRKAVQLPAPRETAPALPPDAAMPGQTPFVTANGDFYRIDVEFIVPQVDPSDWTLTIDGLVSNKLTLTYDQLLARPMIERYITLCCVSNEVGGDLISNAKFLGVRLKDLLEEAGVAPDADQVVGRSTNGFTAGAPTSVIMDGRDAMIAVGMNGVPLPVEHGFPARMVVPGLYGYVSATKWLTEIELARFSDFNAYWIPRGWSQLGPVKTESRIDTPRNDASKPAGKITVAGVAWAQHRGISKVEVQVDNDPWQEATLDAVPSTDTWRQWYWVWDAAPGNHIVRVRATDNAGETQTADVADVAPNGATGYHTIKVTIK